MITAVRYMHNGKTYQTEYGQNQIRLPIYNITKDRFDFAPWGNPGGELAAFPDSPVAHIDQVKNNQWDALAPIPIRIQYQSLLITDRHGQTYWHDNPKDPIHWGIKGLMARHHNQRRIYILIRSTDLAETLPTDNTIMPCMLRSNYVHSKNRMP